MRSIACEHAAVTPGGWGAGWQTAHWAMLAGEAAWLVWDRLTPQTREYVAQMIVYEADRRSCGASTTGPTRRAAVVTPGDTKAEENAWNSGGPRARRGDDAQAPQARTGAARRSTSRPPRSPRLADINSGAVVNGHTLADRLDGANAYDDGTVENHRIVHPDYMTNIQQSWWAADVAGLAGRTVPQSAFHNAATGLRRVHDAELPRRARPLPSTGSPTPRPAGRIYRPGSNDIYYPQGSFWGTVRRAHFVSFDAHAWPTGWTHGAPGRPATRWPPTSPGSRRSVRERHRRRAHLQLRPADRERAGHLQRAARSTPRRSWPPAGSRSTSAATPGTSGSTCRRSTAAGYAPIGPLTQAQTGWFGQTQGPAPRASAAAAPEPVAARCAAVGEPVLGLGRGGPRAARRLGVRSHRPTPRPCWGARGCSTR